MRDDRLGARDGRAALWLAAHLGALSIAILGPACETAQCPVGYIRVEQTCQLPEGGISDGDATGTDAPPDSRVELPDGTRPVAARTMPTSGAALALTNDDRIAVVANRQAGSIAIFDVSPGATETLTRRAQLAVEGSEPWSVVIGNDAHTAFVVLRRDQEIVRVVGLDSSPSIAETRGRTGSEPTSIAISPMGRTLYVANWADGTVSVIDAPTLETTRVIDLNTALVATGSLGASASARPGLAHPRSLVVTNDGDTDDLDETLYVTEFFGQQRTDLTAGDTPRYDVDRQGIVYVVSLSDPESVGTIAIAPIPDTGFADTAAGVTGCFPNQLDNATIESGRLFVSGVCASPRGASSGPGPAGAFSRTQLHTAIYQIDLATQRESPEGRALLTALFQRRYDDLAVPDDRTRRMPLVASGLAFARGERALHVSALGSDAVFRVTYGADWRVSEVGAGASHFTSLTDVEREGRLPIGIAITAGADARALVLNEGTRNVSVISLTSGDLLGAVEAVAMPAPGSDEASILEGRVAFASGIGRWSLRGQGWLSCESCHPGGLSDGVTWYFPRGPRQTISLDGTFDSADPTAQRVLNWTAVFDEVHDFESFTRLSAGGVGAIVHTDSMPPVDSDRIHFDGTMPVPVGQVATSGTRVGLSGSAASLMPAGSDSVRSVRADWDRIERYVQSIRTPRRPEGLVTADVASGRALFEQLRCAGCHGSPMWTVSRVFYEPGEINNHPTTGLLRMRTYTAPSAMAPRLNPPSSTGDRTASLRTASATIAHDQIQCVLRGVGTFPETGILAVAPAGVVIEEVRQDMTMPAQGLTGFNPPSLLGMATGAPYFHAGQARTLEEALSSPFELHHYALAALPVVGEAEIRALVAFLSSIDESSPPIDVPGVGELGYDVILCPDTL